MFIAGMELNSMSKASNVVTDIWKGTTNAVGSSWKEFIKGLTYTGHVIAIAHDWLLDKVIEPIAHAVGFEDKVFVDTAVIAQKMFADNSYDKRFLQVIYEHQLPKYNNRAPFSTSLLSLVDFGHAQYFRFYMGGINYFNERLPQTNVVNIRTDIATITKILEDRENASITIERVMYTTPTYEEWVSWYLQEEYEFSLQTNTLTYQGTKWLLDSFKYLMEYNTFNCTLKTISSTIKIIEEITTVTVEALNMSYDTIHTLIQHRTSIFNHLAVLVSTSTVLVSNISTSAPIGSVANSITSKVLSEETTSSVDSMAVLNIPSYGSVLYYIVLYSINNTAIKKYWLYSPTENSEILKAPATNTTNFEMFPIVSIRNAAVNINSGIEEPPEIKDPDNPYIESDESISRRQRYNETSSMLKRINLDLDTLIDGINENPDVDKLNDTFILFGVSPSNTSAIVSKVLYETFTFLGTEYIADETTEGNTMTAMFIDPPYNGSLTWIPKPVEVIESIIGSVNTYTHEVIQKSGLKSTTYHSVVSESIGGCSQQNYETTKISYTDGTVVYTSTRLVDTVKFARDPITTQCVLMPVQKQNSSYPITLYNVVLKKQISSTTVEIITLTNVISTNIITTVKHGAIKDNEARTCLLNPTSPNFIIPLSYYIVTQKLTITDQSKLFEESLYLMFYAQSETDVKWYSSEKFMLFIQGLAVIIAFLVFVFSLGTATVLSVFLINFAISLAVATGLSLAIKYLILPYIKDPILAAMLTLIVAVALTIAGNVAIGAETFITAYELLGLCLLSVDTYTSVNSTNLEIKKEQYTSYVNDELEKLKNLQEEYKKGFQLPIYAISDSVPTNVNFDQYKYLALEAYRDYNLLLTKSYDKLTTDYYDNKFLLGSV